MSSKPFEPARSTEDAELNAMLVHDMRSPIAAIAANFAFLRHALQKSDPSLLEAVADAEVATQTLLYLVENFALLSSLESGAPQPLPEEVSLPGAARACVDRLGAMASSSEVALDLQAAGGPEPCVRATPLLLSAALDNLVLAAVRHTPRRKTVRICLFEEAGLGGVEVQDGGGSVAPELAAGLYTRAGQRLAKREPQSRYGRGLGLLVVGLAVAANGGRAETVSREGTNVFRVGWPLCQ